MSSQERSVKRRLGIDFGRVIQGGADQSGGAEDTPFLGAALDQAVHAPATEGVFDVLPGLIARFDRQAWIISKCGSTVEAKTRAWLDHNDFFARTGLPPGNVRFCRTRAEKAPHCRELGITDMIDDRLDVHAAIREFVPYRYLFGPQGAEIPNWVIHVRSWAEFPDLPNSEWSTT